MRKIFFVFLCISAFMPAKAQKWNLVWSDEFTVSGSPDAANWGNEVGFVRNKELQYYTNSRLENAKVENGNLLIIGKKENYSSSGKNAEYTSASLTTDGKHSWTYGKFEARIKLPQGQGLWPAFWLLGQNIRQIGWPKCGEIDIMEHINADEKIYGTMHWDNNGHVGPGGNVPCDVSKYHVYSIEWDKDAIKWFVDGNKYWEGNIKDNVNSTDELHQPFYIILNLAIGGNWPKNPDSTTAFPDTMFVDYVRVYQNKIK